MTQPTKVDAETAVVNNIRIGIDGQLIDDLARARQKPSVTTTSPAPASLPAPVARELPTWLMPLVLGVPLAYGLLTATSYLPPLSTGFRGGFMHEFVELVRALIFSTPGKLIVSGVGVWLYATRQPGSGRLAGAVAVYAALATSAAFIYHQVFGIPGDLGTQVVICAALIVIGVCVTLRS